MNTNNNQNKINFSCEICGNHDFYEFIYPVHTWPLKRKILWGAMRRLVVNPVKFLIRLALSLFPSSYFSAMRKKAWNPYKRLQSPREIFSTLEKIEQATHLFENRKIIICKECELGTIYPRISEAELINYYKKDYWVVDLGEIEPAENNRTIITYKLLKEHLDFEKIKNILEFGSASGHLSRYIKTKEKSIYFDCVDPGILWKELLQKELRNIYGNIDEITDTYDVIMSSHAFEHLSSVETYFRIFFHLLNIGGYLYFEVPNSEERDTIFGPHPDYHIPHTFFFSPDSVSHIARKFGLTPVFVKTFSRSYKERFTGQARDVLSTDEHPKGAYLRVLLRK